QVVDNLKQYIISGDLSVGDKLPSEASLCEKLSVGRGTIREAMRILQAKGFVEIKAGRGAFVFRTEEFDKNDIIAWFAENEIEVIDLLEVRAAIEPLAVKLAIQRSTSKDVEKLKQILADTDEAVERNDVPAIAELDEKFHSFIVKCSRNKLLISINSQIVHYLKAFREKTFFIPSNAKNLLIPHGKIVSAFVEKDENAGSQYMIEHLEWVRKDLKKSKDPDAL
ncbi:MAG: FadR/GntR family transcriptional regulator, partial [Oscillospiraceae bacterium]